MDSTLTSLELLRSVIEIISVIGLATVAISRNRIRLRMRTIYFYAGRPLKTRTGCFNLFFSNISVAAQNELLRHLSRTTKTVAKFA